MTEDEHHRRDAMLASYALTLGDAVEAELLTTHQTHAEGTVTGATYGTLILATGPTRRTVRVAWHAIAVIRNAIPAHPATEV